MPVKRPQLVNQEIYHIIIRGTGDSLIFKDESDYYRGIFSIYEFNTIKPIEIKKRRHERQKIKVNGEPFSDTRDLMVEILAFCFMPNHIHLLLRQLKDKGISEFVKKVGVGYAGYFNKKYDRKGPLFSKFRAVHIKDDIQLKVVFAYIHVNPASLIEPGWKENGIKDSKKVIGFLKKYKWSSYQDYSGKKNFPSVTERDFFLKTIGDEKNCREFVENWVEYKKGTKNYSDSVLVKLTENRSPSI